LLETWIQFYWFLNGKALRQKYHYFIAVFMFDHCYNVIANVVVVYIAADVCKKKWRLLRSSLIRYIKVFKDKATSKGNRYRPYYLLEHMDFLLPFIDEKTVIRKVKPPTTTTAVIKTQPATSGTTVTLQAVKKDRNDDHETILYNPSSNTITYNVVATTSSKDSSSQELKGEQQQQTQDIQQYYNAGVKIIGEDYQLYQPGEQLIYQATSTPNDEQQLQHQEVIQQEHEQQELQPESPNKSQMGATLIPFPNISSMFSSTSPSEVSQLINF
jgi:hypothetical protein